MVPENGARPPPETPQPPPSPASDSTYQQPLAGQPPPRQSRRLLIIAAIALTVIVAGSVVAVIAVSRASQRAEQQRLAVAAAELATEDLYDAAETAAEDLYDAHDQMEDFSLQIASGLNYGNTLDQWPPIGAAVSRTLADYEDGTGEVLDEYANRLDEARDGLQSTHGAIGDYIRDDAPEEPITIGYLEATVALGEAMQLRERIEDDPLAPTPTPTGSPSG